MGRYSAFSGLGLSKQLRIVGVSLLIEFWDVEGHLHEGDGAGFESRDNLMERLSISTPRGISGV